MTTLPQMLKMIYVLRHGENGPEGDLTQFGRAQFRLLSDNIALGMPIGYSVSVCTSPELRAQQSAEILAQRFNTGLRAIDELRRDEFRAGGIQLAAIADAMYASDAVCVVTHLAAVSGIINAALHACFQREIPYMPCSHANGMSFDVKTGEIIPNLLLPWTPRP